MIYFVTGGSRGIGAAIVVHAAKAGHDVAFTYFTNKERAEQVVAQAQDANPTGTYKAYHMDVRDPEAVEHVVEQVLDDFDTVEVVVNNAGACRDNLLISMSNEEWDDVIATNLTGPFYVCRQFMTTLLSQRFGRIINISSISANGRSGQANYAAAKAGLLGLTQSIAKEYGRKNITANILSLGLFHTDMTENLPSGLHTFWNTYCPQGRSGQLKEVSDAVNFLASPAGSFINGQILPITGGLNWVP